MDALTHHPFYYKANPRKMEEPTTQKNALGSKILVFRAFRTACLLRHIMLEGLTWQTHRQPAVGAAAISLILPTAS